MHFCIGLNYLLPIYIPYKRAKGEKLCMTNLLVNLFIKNYDDIKNQEVRHRYGILSGAVGIFCNLILCVLKFVSGIMSSSIAIIADAFNNLSDAGSSVVTLIGFKIANKPADKQHPFGYGRIEYVSGLIVSVIIVFMGIELISSSVEKLISNEVSEINWFSFFILIFSLLVKIWLCLFNKNLGKKINSVTLKTISFDSLSDAIATLTVIIGMIITYFTGVSVDGYAGIIVALFIVYTGVNTARETVNPLIGQKPDKNFVEKVRRKALSYKEILGVHDILVHNYGPQRSLVSLHAEVPADIPISRLHKVIDKIECDIKEQYNCMVLIHMDPVLLDQGIIDLMKPKISEFLSTIGEDIIAEDFRLIEDEGYIHLIFEVFVPVNNEIENETLVKAIKNYVNNLNSNYRCIIHVQHYKP